MAVKKRAAGKKTSAKRPSARRSSTKKARTAPVKKAPAKKARAKKPSMEKRYASRTDLGAPADAFFAKQPPHLRPLIDELKKMITSAAPDATAALKWGMPFYSLGGEMICGIGAHKAHVNLILPGAPGTYADPEGRLTGEGNTGRRLTLSTLEGLPRDAVRAWLKTAVARARG